MRDALPPASIDWTQGVPFAREFGDVYFSRAGGPAETRHVFLAQSALPQRFTALTDGAGFTLVETGFGTGLNFLVTMQAWRQAGADGWLHYVSVEKFPLTPVDLARAHACWPELGEEASALQRHYPVLVAGFHRLVFPAWRVTLTLFLGDVADFLPRLDARADAWFLDGFAPNRNADMWNDALYQGMARLSRPGATVATFTAAGTVCRGLAKAGFAMEKVPGHGQKREMLRGVLPTPALRAGGKPWLQRPRCKPARREACVIGAGIAGSQVAHRLAQRGWHVTVLEQAGVASAGSGNPAAVVYGRLAAPGKALDHFSQAAWLFALRELAQSGETGSAWHPCGLVQLALGNQADLTTTLATRHLPEDLVRPVSAEEASRLAGVAIDHEALFFPGAGWLEARRHCRALLAHPLISIREETRVDALMHQGEGWRLQLADGGRLEAPVVVIATAGAATQFAALDELPLRTVRGQVSLVPPSPESAALRTLVCHDGYISPALPGRHHCLGATFQPGTPDIDVRAADHRANRALLAQALPALAATLAPEAEWQGRAALRCQSPDYLPLVGPVADPAEFDRAYAGLRDGKVLEYPELPALPGLYVNVAHGSKGFSQAALAAEILAAEINDEPAPVSHAVLEALHPMRFRVRALRRGGGRGQR